MSLITRMTRAKALSCCALTLAGGASLGGPAASAAPKADAGATKAYTETLGLERAAVKAYTDIAASNVLSPPVLAVLNGFLADHTAHRDALARAVGPAGGQPPEESAPANAPDLRNEGEVLAFAYDLERSLAGAHLAALAAIRDADGAHTVGSILGVETTHVALLGEALRKGPAYPAGFVTA